MPAPALNKILSSSNLRFETEGSDASIEFRFRGEYETLTIEIDNPWRGDSNSGFGAILEFNLNLTQLTQLRDWLNTFVERGENE